MGCCGETSASSANPLAASIDGSPLRRGGFYRRSTVGQLLLLRAAFGRAVSAYSDGLLRRDVGKFSEPISRVDRRVAPTTRRFLSPQHCCAVVVAEGGVWASRF